MSMTGDVAFAAFELGELVGEAPQGAWIVRACSMHLRTTDQRETGRPVSAWPLHLRLRWCRKKESARRRFGSVRPVHRGCGEAGRYERVTQMRRVGFQLIERADVFTRSYVSTWDLDSRRTGRPHRQACLSGQHLQLSSRAAWTGGRDDSPIFLSNPRSSALVRRNPDAAGRRMGPELSFAPHPPRCTVSGRRAD
jgi:hypothetical protein